MATDTVERPGPDEAYIAATNASDLTLSARRIDAPTILIAAALAGNRMGSALIHLRAEWDRAPKPRAATSEELSERARSLPLKNGKPDLKRAKAESIVHQARAMRECAMRLSGRSAVMGLLTEWATEQGVDHDLLSPALFHWLAPECPVCTGTGKVKANDAPVRTDRKCPHCSGAGTWPRPLGAEVIHDWMKRCVNKARAERVDMLHAR